MPCEMLKITVKLNFGGDDGEYSIFFHSSHTLAFSCAGVQDI